MKGEHKYDHTSGNFMKATKKNFFFSIFSFNQPTSFLLSSFSEPSTEQFHFAHFLNSYYTFIFFFDNSFN